LGAAAGGSIGAGGSRRAARGFELCACTRLVKWPMCGYLFATRKETAMPQSQIEYRSGYKYQLAKDYRVKVSVVPVQDIDTDYIGLSASGILFIKKGYAWDGPSGPTVDTKNFMRGSLVHDALYQLMRTRHLSKTRWRAVADLELKRMCLEDGMSRLRAAWVHRGVRLGGGPAADPTAAKEIHTAP